MRTGHAPLFAALNGRMSAPRKVARAFSRCVVLVFACCVLAHAQGGVPLKTVVTDQTQLNLSGSFGTPAATAIDQKGDFAFVGEGNSALFVRAAGASSVTWLLQNGDAVPGISGSVITSFVPAIFESQAGVLFAVNFSLADGSTHQALLVWSSGATYATVATDTGSAPGTSTTYGTDLQPLGINDSGDVAFSSVVSPAELTLFITPASGAAKRIVGIGDSVPDPTSGNAVLDSLVVTPGLNALGEILFDGLPADAFYVASKTGQITVVAYPSLGQGVVAGGCAPGTLEGVASVALNNTGLVAFSEFNSTNTAICYTEIGSIPSAAGIDGESAPSPVGGTLSFVVNGPFTLDDSGDILFDDEVTSSSGLTNALLRFTASTNQLSVVAYSGETEPSGTSKTFLNFGALSAASDGTVTFVASFGQGGFGVYQQSGMAPPVLVAMQGATAPVTGGGTFDLSLTTSTETLNTHSAFFSSMIAGGSAYFAELLGAPGALQSLVDTGDTLPSGSRVQLSPNSPAAGSFVGFSAQNSGGRTSFFVSNLSTTTNTKIFTEGDSAPGTGGVIVAYQLPNATGFSTGFGASTVVFGSAASSPPPPVPFYLNASGQIAFNFTITGGTSISAISLGSPTANLSKVVAAGDPVPGGSATFLILFPLDSAINPLNNNGQVAFLATIPGIYPSGVFRSNSDGTITKIVQGGDAGPSGGSFSLISAETLPTITLNQSGLVAFEGSANDKGGYYSGDGTATPQPVAVTGDVFAGTSKIFDLPFEPAGLSDNGTLSFNAAAEPGFPAPFLVGSGVAPDTNGPTAIAINGGAAPNGGIFQFTSQLGSNGTVFFPGMTQSNGENDVAFFSHLLGGNSDSGYFISRGTGAQAGVLQSLALQGESVPSGGTLNEIPAPEEPGSGYALGPDGQLIFADSFTNGSATLSGLFVVRQDGSLAKILAAGDGVPGGGTANAVQIAPGLAAGAPGTFAFWSGISGGGARQAIFATQIPAGTEASSTALGSSGSPSALNQSVTFTATVTPTASGTPTGSVTFFDGGVALGPAVTLTNAVATLATSSLAAGSHSITAQYSADATFAPSTSAVFTQPVNGSPDFSMSASPSSLSIVAGQSGQVTITVTPVNGSTQTVTFSCTGLPAQATCEADPSSLTLDGTHSATMTITIQTTANGATAPAGRVRPVRLNPLSLQSLETIFATTTHSQTRALEALEMIFGMLAFACALHCARRRRIATLLIWLLIAVGSLVTGCGGGGNSGGSGGTGTPAGAYAISITIASGGSSHSSPVSVTVTN
jgi:VCBS repeat-containing protein